VHILRGNLLASKSTNAKEAFKIAMKALKLLNKENYEKNITDLCIFVMKCRKQLGICSIKRLGTSLTG
jgi:hypothetical protein